MSLQDVEEYSGAELPDCSLEEILIANRMVANAEPTINPDGSRSYMMSVAYRLLAAVYALANYGSPEVLLAALGFEFDVEDEFAEPLNSTLTRS